MPAKLSTICYIHDSTQRLTKEYSIKEITGISRLSDEDPTKIIYLKIKAFVPLDKEIDTQIEKFENGQVNATSIKPMPSLDFDMMPAVTNLFLTFTWKKILEIENQRIFGLLYYQESIIDTSTTEESIPGKHILKLDDISLISSNRPNMSAQSINLPWLNQESTSSKNTPRTPRGSTPRLKRGCVTLSQLSSTRKTRSQSLASALQENPLPTMTQNETSSET
ncbi:unnamed protein product [Rhizophagus irregularis]|nr:unnamed protein product [Rhizophagus irregularis]CAB5298516.1 unnamed protein product [Rhizophagus irregularis]